MAFNHYAKMKRILESYEGWYVVQVDTPTTSRGFNGELRQFDHYYRIYDANDTPIPYCKFQQLDRLAAILNVDVDSIVVVPSPNEI